jgi:hypothetical protein
MYRNIAIERPGLHNHDPGPSGTSQPDPWTQRAAGNFQSGLCQDAF